MEKTSAVNPKETTRSQKPEQSGISAPFLDVTILCKVVDNFGDIGVVFRLSRALSDFPNISLRIITDNLRAFSLLSPGINPGADEQFFNGWQIFNWNASDACLSAFTKNPPHLIIECFQCGRPEWLDHLLFNIKIPNIARIIMLDYLTAETYAETFHCLKSLTRSARVQKVNFMPGFTPKTGGLILDRQFLKSLQPDKGGACPSLPSNPLRSFACPLPPLLGDTPKTPQEPSFNILFFSYPQNHTPVINAIQTFSKNAGCSVKVLLAQGAGFDSFKSAYKSAREEKSPSEKPIFKLTELPFLPQTDWDALMCKTPLLFIRGEDSLSRACLCGVPFIWNAYPQSDDYQLVKVQALLDRMRPHFPPELFEKTEACWLTYNGAQGNLNSAITNFLLSYAELRPCFKDFSRSLLQNGDLADNLIEFMIKISSQP